GADQIDVTATHGETGLSSLTVDTGGDTGESITFSSNLSIPGVAFTAACTAGAITDTQAGTTNDLTAATAAFDAGSGIGSVVSGSALETTVTSLEAHSTTGNVVIDQTGAVTVGGVSSALR